MNPRIHSSQALTHKSAVFLLSRNNTSIHYRLQRRQRVTTASERGALCVLRLPPWSSRNSSIKPVLHPSVHTPSHPPSAIWGTVESYWSRVDLMLNGEMAKRFHFEMIYWHETLSAACCHGNCANAIAVYHPSPWPFVGSIQRDFLWMWNIRQWVQCCRVRREVKSTHEEL